MKVNAKMQNTWLTPEQATSFRVACDLNSNTWSKGLRDKLEQQVSLSEKYIAARAQGKAQAIRNMEEDKQEKARQDKTRQMNKMAR